MNDSQPVWLAGPSKSYEILNEAQNPPGFLVLHCVDLVDAWMVEISHADEAQMNSRSPLAASLHPSCPVEKVVGNKHSPQQCQCSFPF